MLRFTHFLKKYCGAKSCYKAILDFMPLCTTIKPVVGIGCTLSFKGWVSKWQPDCWKDCQDSAQRKPGPNRAPVSTKQGLWTFVVFFSRLCLNPSPKAFIAIHCRQKSVFNKALVIYVPARKNMWKCSNRKMKKSRSNVILKRLQRTVKKKLLIAKIQEKYRAFQELHLQFLINMHIIKKFKTRMTIFLDVQNFENGEHWW